ncbi:MAG: phage portal protein [Paraclostridium sp.]
MRTFKYPKGTKATKELVIELIGHHSNEKSRVVGLNNYYRNQNDILNRSMNDPLKPNNKLAHGYASYITDMATGYFLGKPLSYKSDDKEFVNEITNLGRVNFEHDTNTTLSKLSSISGYAFLLLYINEQGLLKYKPMATEEIIFVTDNSIEEVPMFAIRYWHTNQPKVNVVEIYNREEVISYTLDLNGLGKWEENYRYKHLLGGVPVVRYLNNDEMIGDFERVKTLIDAYDLAESDSANDFEYFTNAYLGVYGSVVSKETANLMSENRILNFPNQNSKAEFLTKNINDSAVENYKNRLQDDIHKFSMVPALTDEQFAGNVSGEAMKYKLMGLENLCSIKEQKFRKATMQRLQLICNYLAIKKNLLFDVSTMDIQFTRNLPKNEIELSEMVKNLFGIISEETSLSLLPFVDDVNREMDRKQIEKQIDNDPYGL